MPNHMCHTDTFINRGHSAQYQNALYCITLVSPRFSFPSRKSLFIDSTRVETRLCFDLLKRKQNYQHSRVDISMLSQSVDENWGRGGDVIVFEWGRQSWKAVCLGTHVTLWLMYCHFNIKWPMSYWYVVILPVLLLV